MALAVLLTLSVLPSIPQNTVMMSGPGDPNQMQAYQLMQQAMGKLQSKDARGAKPLLEQAVRMWPAMPHVHYYLGFCHNDLGEYALAIPEFQQAIQSDPQRVDCMINIATCYQSTGQPGEAANWYERYLQQKPGSPRAGQIKSLIPALRTQAKKLGATGGGPPGAALTGNQTEPDYFSSILIGGKSRRWLPRKLPLKVYIANGINELQVAVAGFKPDYNYILADAMNTWLNASGNRLAVQYVTDPSQADIAFFWTDNPNFYAAMGQIEQGTAFRQEQELPDGSVEIVRASVTLLINDRNGGGALNNTQMARACLHEIGHALGLAGHSMNPADIMFYSELANAQPVLSERDQRTISRLYQNYPQLRR